MLEAETSKIKVPAELLPGEDSLPGLQVATSWLHPHKALLCHVVSLLIRTVMLLDKGPPIGPHLTLITSLEALSPNTVTLGG